MLTWEGRASIGLDYTLEGKLSWVTFDFGPE